MRKMVNLGLALGALAVAGCSTAVPSTPITRDAPTFASANTSFQWYSAHPKGAIFQYLEDTDGNRFVMTHDFRGTSMLLPLMFVPVQSQFGMMLDDKLCSNGRAAYRGANSKNYFVNIVPSINESIREAPPKGICFTLEKS